MSMCPDCGFMSGKCIECDGTGEDPGFLSAIGSMFDGDLMECDNCGGTGTCPTCDGSGFIDDDDDEDEDN